MKQPQRESHAANVSLAASVCAGQSGRGSLVTAVYGGEATSPLINLPLGAGMCCFPWTITFKSKLWPCVHLIPEHISMVPKVCLWQIPRLKQWPENLQRTFAPPFQKDTDGLAPIAHSDVKIKFTLINMARKAPQNCWLVVSSFLTTLPLTSRHWWHFLMVACHFLPWKKPFLRNSMCHDMHSTLFPTLTPTSFHHPCYPLRQMKSLQPSVHISRRVK